MLRKQGGSDDDPCAPRLASPRVTLLQFTVVLSAGGARRERREAEYIPARDRARPRREFSEPSGASVPRVLVSETCLRT